MLGIIGAMDEEVLKIKEHMEQVTVETYAGMEFHRGMLNGKELVVVRSGIGKVNAGICSQILVDKFGVEGIVNTGVAGSLKMRSTSATSFSPPTRFSTTWTPPVSAIPMDRSPVWTRFLSRHPRN